MIGFQVSGFRCQDFGELSRAVSAQPLDAGGGQFDQRKNSKSEYRRKVFSPILKMTQQKESILRQSVARCSHLV